MVEENTAETVYNPFGKPEDAKVKKRKRSTATWRTGVGPSIAPVSAKLEVGRSFIRGLANHQGGGIIRGPEAAVERSLDGVGRKTP